MSPSENYTGRTTDLFIFQGAALVGDRKITLSFGGDTGGEVTTGIQKLSQIFAMVFLTEKGSIADKPAWGTDFMSSVRSGLVRNEQDVRSLVSLCIEQARVILRLIEEQNTVPPDEQFGSASLSDFDLDEATGTLKVYIALASEAGANITVYLPIPVPIH